MTRDDRSHFHVGFCGSRRLPSCIGVAGKDCMQFLIWMINDDYVEYLHPREQYRLAATESGTWRIFVLRYERQQDVDERYWEIDEEGWFSD